MLLGKRLRPPMRRTTSMTKFDPDLDVVMDPVDAPQPSDSQQYQYLEHQQHQQIDWMARSHVATTAGTLSPRSNYRRSSSDFMAVETAPFLKACGLCKRRLAPGRDIYMYRGEIAFCSLECRQQLINQEEQKEKCALSLMKTKAQPTTTATAASTEASGSSSETVAAA